MTLNLQSPLPVGIIFSGLFIVSIGYEAIKKKRMRFMPINRGEVLEGDRAVKVGKQIVVIGLVVATVGLIFLLLPS